MRETFPYEYYDFLEKLDEKDREVLILYYGLCGKPKLTLLQIAEVFRTPGLDTNSIRNVIAVAMGKLREAYDKHKLRAGVKPKP